MGGASSPPQTIDPCQEGGLWRWLSPTPPDKGTHLLSAKELIYMWGQERSPKPGPSTGRESFQPMRSHLAAGPFCLQN